MAKILFLDIETSPLLGYAWQMYDANLLKIVKPSYILSAAWKWAGDKKVSGLSARYGNDKALCSKLIELIEDADLVVYQNGDAFDMKIIRTRSKYWGLRTIPPVATVDTLKQFRKYYRFHSNKLDDVCDYLKIGRKAKHSGFDMWLGCMKNNAADMRQMLKYNKHDVVITEAVYNSIRNQVENHPKVKPGACNKCGSFSVTKWGFRSLAKQRQQRWLCHECGGYFLTPVGKNHA